MVSNRNKILADLTARLEGDQYYKFLEFITADSDCNSQCFCKETLPSPSLPQPPHPRLYISDFWKS